MQVGSFLSPNGRLSPRPFIYGAIAVYILGAASHALTVPGVIARFGLWPFMAIQIVLIWIWFVLHARRLRDAGRSIGIAAGASILYALSIVLLLIVVVGFSDHPMSNPNAGGALNVIMLIYVITSLSGSLESGIAWAIIAMFTALAFVPMIVALAVTLWAATRPAVVKMYGQRS
jgi:uncharacterized membrane protein YhaH (DUF805 family)